MPQTPAPILAAIHTLGVQASARARTQNIIDDNIAFDRAAIEQKSAWLRPNGRLRIDRLLSGAARRAEHDRIDASVDELRRDARAARKADHSARIVMLDGRRAAGDFQWQQYGASEFLW